MLEEAENERILFFFLLAGFKLERKTRKERKAKEV